MGSCHSPTLSHRHVCVLCAYEIVTTFTPLPAQPLPRGLHRLLTRTRCTASVWMAQNGWTTDRDTVPPTIRACVHALSLHTDLQSGRWGGAHSPPLLVG